jgi:hypothetical protein
LHRSLLFLVCFGFIGRPLRSACWSHFSSHSSPCALPVKVIPVSSSVCPWVLNNSRTVQWVFIKSDFFNLH